MPRSFQYMADVSSNNGEIDVPTYSRAGHAILAIKATQGTGYRNPFHFKQSSLAHEFGITVVHYHFFEQDADIGKQIANFRAVYNKTWHDGDYACFDVEKLRLHPDPISTTTNDLLRKYALLTGHQPILYTGRYYRREQLKEVIVPGKREWIADYSNNPIPWKVWARQYTDGENGPGPHYYSGIGKCDGSIVGFGPALAAYGRKIKNRKRK